MEMTEHTKINAGIYLVIDPSMEESELLERLEKAVSARPCAIQIWDNFQSQDQIPSLFCKVKMICRGTGIPILINNHPEWDEMYELDGVHFDELTDKHLLSIPKLKQ